MRLYMRIWKNVELVPAQKEESLKMVTMQTCCKWNSTTQSKSNWGRNFNCTGRYLFVFLLVNFKCEFYLEQLNVYLTLYLLSEKECPNDCIFFPPSKETETLKNELSLQRMKALYESQRVLEVERKLFTNERHLQACQSENMNLRVMLDELKMKYEPEGKQLFSIQRKKNLVFSTILPSIIWLKKTVYIWK